MAIDATVLNDDLTFIISDLTPVTVGFDPGTGLETNPGARTNVKREKLPEIEGLGDNYAFSVFIKVDLWTNGAPQGDDIVEVDTVPYIVANTEQDGLSQMNRLDLMERHGS